MKFIFWFLSLLIIYIYIGYPALMSILSKTRPLPVKKSEYTPPITILIPAYNEASVIQHTIDNKLSLNYPKDKIEIIVVSDESEDRTDEIVRSYEHKGVRLLRQSPRKGKTSALNMAIPEAQGEIIIFSDANSIYDKNALLQLTRNFSDKQVGYVTGKMIYVNSDGSLVGDGCSAYMKYENALRQFESDTGSIVGVDGGIDAVRKQLYSPMRPDQLPDFVLPLSIIEKGYRVVYEPEALLKEEALSTGSSEYAMRVRVALRAFWAMKDKRALFNINRYSLFSWQFFSHKLLRYIVFLPLTLVFLINILLAPGSLFFSFTFLLQSIFYILAILGFAKDAEQNKPAYIALPYYFALLNIASAHAFLRFLKGEKQVIWKPRVG